MTYYFVFNNLSDVLTKVLTENPKELFNERVLEWNTEDVNRKITFTYSDPDLEDEVLDLFENAIPGFSTYPGSEADKATPFQLVDDIDEAVIQEAKEVQLELVRLGRNDKLSKSDWTQGNDSPLSDENKTLWNTYRQELRDITKDLSNPFIVPWPTEPS